MNALPSEPSESSIVALVDSREQCPLDLSPLQAEIATLTTGDYSLKGLESIVAIERKSLPDLVGCVGRDRERFEREVQRLLAFPVRCLVIEADWTDVEERNWSPASRIEPKHVKGSLLGWQAAGLPVLMSGNHRRAGEMVSRMLFIAARRRWKEARGLIQSVLSMENAE